MPRALPVFLAVAAAGVVSRLSLLWIREGSDGSMLTRLKSWVQGSRQRKRREADHGHLSEQEKHVADAYQRDTAHTEASGPYPMKGFDEQSRGRPRN
jgi:hypothetical protein